MKTLERRAIMILAWAGISTVVAAAIMIVSTVIKLICTMWGIV